MVMFGFTRKESGLLLFLITTFIVGMGIQLYRTHVSPLPCIVSEERSSICTASVEPAYPNKSSVFIDEEKMICISLNHSNKTDLEKLPGIGPKTAERIIAYRTQNGAFLSIEELTKVKGIGEKTFQKLEPYLKLN